MYTYVLLCVSSLIFGITCLLIGFCIGILLTRKAGMKDGEYWNVKNFSGKRRYYAYDEEKALGALRRSSEYSSESDQEPYRKADSRKLGKPVPTKKRANQR